MAGMVNTDLNDYQTLRDRKGGRRKHKADVIRQLISVVQENRLELTEIQLKSEKTLLYSRKTRSQLEEIQSAAAAADTLQLRIPCCSSC